MTTEQQIRQTELDLEILKVSMVIQEMEEPKAKMVFETFRYLKNIFKP